ncbi:MAG: hypothetical protein ACRDJP_01900, partial [Actinomycetota bacterium]
LRVVNEVRKMLESLRPSHVEPDQTRAEPIGKHAVAIHVPHRKRPDDSLVLTVEKGDIAVGFSYEHIHFFPEKDAEWVEEALYFIWDLLRGRIELELIFKGRVLLKTRTYRIADDGSSSLVETGGNIVPFNPFAQKRIERYVPSFSD